MESGVIILRLLYMYTGIEQLTKWLLDREARLLTAGVDVTEERGKEPRMTHMIVD